MIPLRLVIIPVLLLNLGACSKNTTPTQPTTTTTTATSATVFSVLVPSSISIATGDSTQIRAVVSLRAGLTGRDDARLMAVV